MALFLSRSPIKSYYLAKVQSLRVASGYGEGAPLHFIWGFGEKLKQLSGFDSPRPHAAYSKAFSFFLFETNTVRALFVITKSGGAI
jgi:hypothetical protein